MATIRRLQSGRWQVQVRRRGHPAATRSFAAKIDAHKWARKTEVEIERGIFTDTHLAAAIDFAALLDRYADQVTSKKRGKYIELKSWSCFGEPSRGILSRLCSPLTLPSTETLGLKPGSPTELYAESWPS